MSMKRILIATGLVLLSISAIAQTYSKDLAKKAKQGDYNSQCELGICYYKGLGTKVDNAKAFELFASSLCNTFSTFYMGSMIEEGKYDPSFDKEGIYESLKDQSQSLELEFATISPNFNNYLQSCSNPTDAKIAYMLYLKAYKRGYKDAAMKIGNFLKEHNDIAAIDYYKKAGDSGKEAMKSCSQIVLNNITFTKYNKETDAVFISGDIIYPEIGYKYKKRLLVLKDVGEINGFEEIYAEEILFEETNNPLIIKGDKFYGDNCKEIVFTRPIFLDSYTLKKFKGALVFNKEVVNTNPNVLGEYGLEKVVFKQVPKSLNKEFICKRSLYSGLGLNVERIEIPKGTMSKFLAFGFPEDALFESGSASLSLTIKLEKPNSILTALSPDKLKDIDSLTVIGYMYETDVKVLSDCKNLRFLDLSKAYITYSPEEKKNIQQSQEAFKALFSFLGVAADAKYLDGNMTTLDYAFTKGFTRLVSESPNQISEADNGCIIPSRSFQKMKCLETVILPYRMSEIESHSFKYCSSLRNVVLPKHLKIIGQGCFHGCKSLQNIDIPASIKSIGIADMGTGILDGEGSFTDTGLKKLDLSKCVFDEATGPGGLVKWSFTARDNEALKDIRIPQGATFVQLMLHHTENFTLYVPASVNTIFMRYIEGNNTYHFMSMTPPRFTSTSSEIINSTVYVPKGSTTAYYSAFGNTNKYIEE